MTRRPATGRSTRRSDRNSTRKPSGNTVWAPERDATRSRSCPERSTRPPATSPNPTRTTRPGREGSATRRPPRCCTRSATPSNRRSRNGCGPTRTAPACWRTCTTNGSTASTRANTTAPISHSPASAPTSTCILTSARPSRGSCNPRRAHSSRTSWEPARPSPAWPPATRRNDSAGPPSRWSSYRTI